MPTRYRVTVRVDDAEVSDTERKYKEVVLAKTPEAAARAAYKYLQGRQTFIATDQQDYSPSWEEFAENDSPFDFLSFGWGRYTGTYHIHVEELQNA